MKLSEAILLGSLETYQVFGLLFDDKGGACALGAAIIAADLRVPEGMCIDYIDIVEKVWPLAQHRVLCPTCGHHNKVTHLIHHLNDRHGWTRPAIAEHISQYESIPIVQSQETTILVEAT